jgi:hypothetical protein
MKLCKGTVVTYLKKGYELKLTDYNSVISIKNNYKNNGRRIKTINSKSIISIDKGIIFESSVECSNISENIFGIKLTQGGITRIARGERQYYKGYQFKFISDLTEDQIKQIQENAKLN